MILYCDNKSAISIVTIQFSMIGWNTKIDWYFIKEKLDSSPITTSIQYADLFTKCLPTKRFHDFACKPGVIDIHSLAWGGNVVSTILILSVLLEAVRRF